MADSDRARALQLQLQLKVQVGGGKPQMKPIATTRDGGEIYEMQDGSLSFKSPGYATNDQAVIQRLMEGAKPVEEVQRSIDEQRIAANPIAARVQEFNQGAPLVGEWLDEGVEALGFTESAENMRRLSDAMERQRPGQSTALNIAGGVGYTAPLVAAGAGGKVADWVAKGGSRFAQAARGGLVAAPGAAVEGASSMAGRAEDGERGRAAGTGALIGGGLGAVLGTIAPMIGEGVANLARRIKKLDVNAIAEEFGLSKPAARVMRSYLAEDDLDSAAAILARNGDDALLAEAGPSTRQALDTAMSTGGGALRAGREAVEGRVQGAGTKFRNTIDDILGLPGGIRAATRKINQKTKAARKAAYDFAYRQPTPMTGEAGQQIENVLRRVDPPDLQKAINSANAMLRDAVDDQGNQLFPNLNIFAEIADDGTVRFSQPLSVPQLDYLARGLYEVADAGTDRLTGQMSGEAARAADQAKALRDALKQSVPGYNRALQLGGDTIKERNALVLGRKLLNSSTTTEDVREAMQSATPGVKAAVRTGLRENLDAVMDRARATIGDLDAGNVDFDTGMNAVGESVRAIRAMLEPGNMKKMRMALGQADADRLFKEMQQMGDVLTLRAAVARNSATAIRQAGQQQMRDEVAPGVVRKSLGNLGNPLDAAKDVTQTIAGIDPRSMGDAERAYFAEIAQALSGIKGQEAQAALAAVKRAMAGQPIKDAEAQLIGRVVSGSGAVGAYQAGKQRLAPPR